jgi:hypothetical protein
MHNIEPYYQWLNLYNAAEDELSPFYGREYSEFYFSNAIYNYYIHPQWDEFGSATMYAKILFADYDKGFCITELIGEWNDCLYNDIMFFKRDVAEILIENGINKFILIGENVLNFHSSDDCYYQEWFEEVEEGWIVGVNFLDHVVTEFKHERIDNYISMGERYNIFDWRTRTPAGLFELVSQRIVKRIDE